MLPGSYSKHSLTFFNSNMGYTKLCSCNMVCYFIVWKWWNLFDENRTQMGEAINIDDQNWNINHSGFDILTAEVKGKTDNGNSAWWLKMATKISGYQNNSEKSGLISFGYSLFGYQWTS